MTHQTSIDAFKALAEAQVIEPYHRFNLIWTESMGYSVAQATGFIRQVDSRLTPDLRDALPTIRQGVMLSKRAYTLVDAFVKSIASDLHKGQHFNTDIYQVLNTPIEGHKRWHQVVVSSLIPEAPFSFIFLFKS